MNMNALLALLAGSITLALPRAALALPEFLDSKAIDGTVREKMDDIQACYQEALDRRPHLRGKVTIAFKVDTDGNVHEAGLAKSTLRDEKAEGCLVGVFETLHFPPFDPCPDSQTKTAERCSRTKVTYPLTFTP